MTKQHLSWNPVLPCSTSKQRLCSPYTAQFWSCRYLQKAISSPSNQLHLLSSMLKFEQQAVGKMQEGQRCDWVQTSWFHRLSIHHQNSPWRHLGPKEQSCPPPTARSSHIPESHTDTESKLVYSLLSADAVMLKDAALPEKTTGSELTEAGLCQPVRADPSKGGRAAPVLPFCNIFVANSERERCICQSHNRALGL